MQLHNGYFNRCKLVIYSTCASGSSATPNNTLNIMQATEKKDAGAVMGYTISVGTQDAHKFEYTFLSCLRTNGSYFWYPTHIQDSETYIWQGNHTINEAFERARAQFADENGYVNDAAAYAVLIGEGRYEYLTTD